MASFGRHNTVKLRILRTVQTLEVDVGHSRYEIAIGPGLLSDRALLSRAIPGRSLLVVTDTTVAPLYLPRLRAALGDRRVADCVLPDGESHKTLQTAALVFDSLVGNKMHRDATVLALGGGVVGDVAGFAAACYQRGVALVQLPTTLLSQVDSSVGGKTGVNHPGGKNLIGAFYQPIAVVADTDTLATLPLRELRAGLAEVIKYGCIWDAALFEWLEGNVGAILARQPEILAHIIARSCEIKAHVVAQDERENGLRAILNFGHTFGHAIEAATAYETFLHGEAVALGMLIAADFSERLGLIDATVPKRLRALLGAVGLPVRPPRIGADRALGLMQMDKKVLAGAVRLVVLEKLGRATIVADYAAATLNATLVEYFA
jgi:3-dehydroquinate synthase